MLRTTTLKRTEKHCSRLMRKLSPGSHHLHSKQDSESEAQAAHLEEQEKKLRDGLAPHKVHKEAHNNALRTLTGQYARANRRLAGQAEAMSEAHAAPPAELVRQLRILKTLSSIPEAQAALFEKKELKLQEE